MLQVTALTPEIQDLMAKTLENRDTGIYVDISLTTECIMVDSKSEASSAYERGLRRIGISAYEQAARASTPKEAAEALENAKTENLNISDFVDAYEQAYA